MGARSSSPGVFSVTKLFLTTLSSARPRPVSSCAALASISPLSRMVWRIASMMRARCASGAAANRGWAVDAALTASETVAKIPKALLTAGEEAAGDAAAGMEDTPLLMSAAIRRAISSISLSVRRAIVGSLSVLFGVADAPAIDDGHDDRVNGPLVCRLGLPGRAAGGNQDDFVRTGSH